MEGIEPAVTPQTRFHQRIVIGTEIEAYSINAMDHKIGRRLPRKNRFEAL